MRMLSDQSDPSDLSDLSDKSDLSDLSDIFKIMSGKCHPTLYIIIYRHKTKT